MLSGRLNLTQFAYQNDRYLFCWKLKKMGLSVSGSCRIKHRFGFTLIELITVIVVLAVMGGIAWL